MESNTARRPTPAPTCMVCAAPLRWPLARGESAVCQSANCRMVMGRAATMPPAASALYLQQQSAQLRAQQARLDAMQRQVAEKAAAEAVENEAHWVALQLTEAAPRVVLPSGPRRQVNVAERRRRAYRDHLNRVIAEAVSGAPLALTAPPRESPAEPAHDPVAALRGPLCALCGGGCCVHGGTDAYLTAATIRRVMAEQPALRPRQVLDAYLSRLSPRAQAGSCINHTDAGCNLPRELRSDTCNVFLCEAQKSLGTLAPGAAAPTAVLVIVRRQNQWNKTVPGAPNEITASARVSATTTQRLWPLPPAAA